MDEKELGECEVAKEENVEQAGGYICECGHVKGYHNDLSGACQKCWADVTSGASNSAFCPFFKPKARPENGSGRDGGMMQVPIKPITVLEAASRAMAAAIEASAKAEEQKTFSSGAKRSKKMPRYDLIPKEAMECLADRLPWWARDKRQESALHASRASRALGVSG